MYKYMYLLINVCLPVSVAGFVTLPELPCLPGDNPQPALVIHESLCTRERERVIYECVCALCPSLFYSLHLSLTRAWLTVCVCACVRVCEYVFLILLQYNSSPDLDSVPTCTVRANSAPVYIRVQV